MRIKLKKYFGEKFINMLERKNDSKDQKKENKITEKSKDFQKDVENIEINIQSESSSVTDVDILTKNSPNKDDQNEENERTDGSLRK